MRLSIIVHVTGVLVHLFSATFLAPAAVAAMYLEWRIALVFLGVAISTFAVGRLMRSAGGAAVVSAAEHMRRMEGLAVVGATWLCIAHLAALPYLWGRMGPIDALFESMSGLTTTGATVLTDFGSFGHGLHFWRAMTQWLGGMGVVALFIAVLPRLAVGGRQLFFAEAAGPTDEKLTPQLRQTALALWGLYAVITGVQVVALLIAGMPLFDAVCNSMTTMAAGGFSPHPQSIAGYQNPAVDVVVTLFMVVAGANFALQYRVVRGSRGALTRDEELRAYLGIVSCATLILFLFLVRDGLSPWQALRHGAFQVASIITTTGFASVDFEQWTDQAKMVLFVLMFVGGCAGSAAGGPKVVRHLLMTRLTLRELKRTMHPRAVLPIKLGGQVVPESILRDIQAFMLLYLVTFAVGAAIVIALGADLMTGLTASIACLGNIGPGFGEIGPMGSFAGLHPISKVVLTLEMWIGRLEVVTVLVFARLEPWRTARWSL